MRPETAEAIQRAHVSIEKAEFMLTGGYFDEAGRLAYGAGLNAARGFIFERTGRIAKTHSGPHSEFSRLTRSDPAFTDLHRRFLGRTFTLKLAADYGEGPAPDTGPAAARDVIDLARDLVTTIEAVIAASPGQKDSP